MRPIRRGVLRGAFVALGLVIVLAGCRLDVDVATMIGEDGHGTVTVTVRADAELLARAPGVLADLRLDDLKAAGWTVAGPATAADGRRRAHARQAVRPPRTATKVLAEVSGPNGPLQQHGRRSAAAGHTAHDDASAARPSCPGLQAFSDPQLVAALGGVAARRPGDARAAGRGFRADRAGLRCPARRRATTGTVGDGTVTWQPPMQPGVVTPLTAQAEHRDADPVAARHRETWANRAFWAWLGAASRSWPRSSRRAGGGAAVVPSAN